MERLEMRMMFKNPLACDLEELGNVVGALESPTKYNAGVLPFHANVEHYRSARDVLQGVNEVTGKEYKPLGEYFLTVMPNDETRHALKGLLEE